MDMTSPGSLFQTYIGIDYSGADAPEAPIKGLAVAVATGQDKSQLMLPTDSLIASSVKANLWSRRNLYIWLRNELLYSRRRLIIGLDHGLSYPLSQLQRLHLNSWDDFLNWNRHTWHTSRLTMKQSKEQTTYVNSTDKRLVEREFIPSAKSVTDLNRISGMQGAVSYSTHTGLAWIYRLRRWQHYGMNVHFWPYDGLQIPDHCHVITEAYPSLYKKRMLDQTDLHPISEHERDAHYIARWMQARDLTSTLLPYLELPTLSTEEKQLVLLEGWVLGCL